MDKKNFYTLSNHLYGITQIPLFLLNKKKEVTFATPPPLKDITSMKNIEDALDKTNSIFLQTDGEMICYAIMKAIIDEEDYFLFLGPVFFDKLSLSSFLKVAVDSKEFSHLSYDTLQMLYQFIPHSSLPYLCNIMTFIYYLLWNKSLSVQELLHDQLDESLSAKIPITTWETLMDRRETANFHTPYSIEQKQMQIIRSGDLKNLTLFFQDPIAGTPGVLSKNPLRHEKNLFISGITLMTRAAIDGGLNEETAYSISDSFIQVVEECNNIKDIHILRDRAMYEFTYQVSTSRKYTQYSPSILRALHYIH
ncbi:MAG TPA: hypothetical protein IAC41_02725, partial [Candidatus Merdenecus merdavium]|nr:hypothetical protein [Candidatus Merdenecus merdavium]